MKLDALKERIGREIRVFETFVSSSSDAALSNGNCTLSYRQSQGTRKTFLEKFIDTGFFSNILIKLLFMVWFLEEVTDDFYEFTAEDYHRLLAAKKEGNDDTTNHSTSKVKFYLPLIIHYFYAPVSSQENTDFLI